MGSVKNYLCYLILPRTSQKSLFVTKGTPSILKHYYCIAPVLYSSVIREKGESQNGCFKKTRHAKIFRKTNISYPLIPTSTYVCVSGGKKCLFFGKFGVFCFLETPVLRFCLLPYYRCIVTILNLLLKSLT